MKTIAEKAKLDLTVLPDSLKKIFKTFEENAWKLVWRFDDEGSGMIHLKITNQFNSCYVEYYPPNGYWNVAHPLGSMFVKDDITKIQQLSRCQKP